MLTSFPRTESIVVVFFGDGALEEGIWHESAEFAKLNNLNVYINFQE